MQVTRTRRRHAAARGCAVTIGNFDGVHRGHQAMLALLVAEARRRDLAACVLTFEPHPRDWFAHRAGRPADAPARISPLRDKLAALAACGIDEVVVVRFDAALAALSPQTFVERVLRDALGARHVLVGDDFRFGAQRAGTAATLEAAGAAAGFDVARMPSHEWQGLRVSSSAVRAALAAGDMDAAAALLGRPYAVSGHVVHGRKLGRTLGFRTLNLRFPHPRPAAAGVFVARVHGLGSAPLESVASLGVRPTVEAAGRVLLETHVLRWPAALGDDGGYGRCVRVELLARLHEERHYPSLQALTDGIAADGGAAAAWFAAAPLSARRAHGSPR